MRNVKYSGIEWIGFVPDTWDINPISCYFKERNEKVSDYDWEPLSVTKQGIVKQLDNAAKSDAHDARKKVCKNDFVINSRSDRKQSCGVSPYDGSVSLINIVLQPKNILPEYVNYLLKNYGFAEEFYRYGSGIVADLWSTNYQKMKKIMIPVPSINEQEKIAYFLDEKIKEIDNAIEKTKETIEDYKKLKYSIIVNYITKGIKKESKLIDSQINWIGNYPETWIKTKLKQFCKINNGKEIINELSPESEFKIEVFGSGGVFKYTDQELYEGESVLFGRKGTLGKPLYVNQKFWTVDTMYYLTFNDSKLLPKYCYYQLIAFDWNPYITQTALPSIVGSTILNCDFVFPSIKEQQEIVQYLDKKCNEIDKLIESKENIVNELENYKKSVIYEYVTGKKEVK